MAKIVDLDALKKVAQRSKTYTDETILVVKNEIDTDIQAKQNATDESLETQEKTVIGAINELNFIVKNYQPPDDFDATVDEDALDDLINGTFNNNE